MKRPYYAKAWTHVVGIQRKVVFVKKDVTILLKRRFGTMAGEKKVRAF